MKLQNLMCRKCQFREAVCRLLLLLCSILVAPGYLSANDNDSKPETKPKPNILFIFADDLSYDSIAAFGNTEVKTPNIDDIARRGTSFTRAYNMGGWNGAVCVASRTMLNSGRFIWNANEVADKLQLEKGNGRLWSLQMKDAGYETFFTGKWHVKIKPAEIFDRAENIRGGMPNQTPEGYNRPHEGKPDKWSPSDPKFEGFWKGGKHWSEVVGDDAISFIDQAKSNDKPFFMYIAFNAPHDPRQSPQKYVDMYPHEKVIVPENFLEEYPYNEGMASGRNLRDERLAPFPRTRYSVQVNRQEYYAIITHMDDQIGRILAALKDSGMADDTYVFFTADHGLSCGHHGLLGKQNMYEHSMRVPFMVAGPDVDQGKKIDSNIYMQDVMATSLELAEIEKPEHVEFKSLLPLMRGQRDQQYESVYGAFRMAQRMIIKDGMKLIVYPEVPKLRLFDIEKDPLEMNDLSDAKEYSSKRDQLLEELFELQSGMNDKLELKEALAAKAND